MTVFAVLGAEVAESAVAEMLVRCVREVVIGRTIGGKNDNPTTSMVFHFCYARRCISCHIAPFMSSHRESIQLPDSTSK